MIGGVERADRGDGVLAGDCLEAREMVALEGEDQVGKDRVRGGGGVGGERRFAVSGWAVFRRDGVVPQRDGCFVDDYDFGIGLGLPLELP